MIRSNGFYWVKTLSRWQVAEWVTFENSAPDGTWYLTGTDYPFSDDDFDEETSAKHWIIGARIPESEVPE